MPRTDVWPEHPVGNALAFCEGQENVSGSVGEVSGAGGIDLLERDIDHHRYGDAEAHHEPAIGDGVAGSAGIEPGEQGEDGETGQPKGYLPADHRHDRRCGLACRGGGGRVDNDQQREVGADFPDMKYPLRHALPAWAALPDDSLAVGRNFGQAADRFGFVLAHHSCDSVRDGTAYRWPPA